MRQKDSKQSSKGMRRPPNSQLRPGPVALVTGGSRGLGRGIVLELARLGWSVVINFAGNREAAAETALLAREAACGREVQLLSCRADISRGADRTRLLAFVRQRLGRLDLLVNNAGVAPAVRADLLEMSEASFDRVLRTNLRGPFFLTQAAARWMLEMQQSQPSADYAPKIVNIGSISAYSPAVNRGEYCISKAGIAMMTALFATRLAEAGILVYELRPGIMATDMTAPVQARYDRLIADGLTPIRRWGTTRDVGLAVAAIAQGSLPFSTGEVINIDGGFHIRRL
jgi:NAD(P)-dependent dehydrogenase (short-subunit alcohol dehydrogenase family)